MKISADFRMIARDALRGKWMTAVLVGLAAMLLGGVVSDGPEVNFHFEGSGVSASVDYAGQTLFSTSGGGMDSGILALLLGSALYITIAAILMAVVYYVLGSIVGVGYARFNLELVDGGFPSFGCLFDYLYNWKTTAIARLLQSVYILLWSLLLIIPGILAAYSYAMTDFVLAENPELTAGEAIARSKELMYGNRWRLFCLNISFIGWEILSALTLGIGGLWLHPYKQAANAAFYREISGTGYMGSSEFYSF